MSILDAVQPPADRTVTYGASPDQLYDVRNPTGDQRGTTVVVIHGGFWRPRTDRTHTGLQSEALAAQGFHVATIEYRRIPGDWPAMASDVLAAIAAARDDPELPGDIVLLGHSAGGHLVTWAAYQPEVRVAGVVSLAGCVDLHLVRDLGLGDGAADAMMGPAADAVWRAADPAMLGPAPVPVRLVHGAADDTVPVEVSESYQAATCADVPLHVLAGCAHLELVDPRSRYFASTLAALDAVLP